MEPSATLEMFGRAPSGVQFQHRSSVPSALSRTAALDGPLLYRFFSSALWAHEESEFLANCILVVAGRLSNGVPETPYFSASLFRLLFYHLQNVVLGTAAVRSTPKAKDVAWKAHSLLLDYAKNMRTDLPSFVVAQASKLPEMAKTETRLSSDTPEAAVSSLSIIKSLMATVPSAPAQYLSDDSVKNHFIAAMKHGHGPELTDLVLQSLPTSKFLGLLPPLCMALAEQKDHQAISSILQRLPAEVTYDPCLFVLVTRLSYRIRSAELHDITLAVYNRSLESLDSLTLRGRHPSLFPLVASSLERLLVFAFKRSDLVLMRSISRTAHKLGLQLNPRSANNVLFVLSDNGMIASAFAMLETSSGIPVEPADEEFDADDVSLAVSLFSLNSSLSDVTMKVFSHLLVSIAKNGRWETVPRFVNILRKLRVTLSDSFCQEVILDARAVRVSPQGLVLLARLFLEVEDVFLVLSVRSSPLAFLLNL